MALNRIKPSPRLNLHKLWRSFHRLLRCVRSSHLSGAPPFHIGLCKQAHFLLRSHNRCKDHDCNSCRCQRRLCLSDKNNSYWLGSYSIGNVASLAARCEWRNNSSSVARCKYSRSATSANFCALRWRLRAAFSSSSQSDS